MISNKIYKIMKDNKEGAALGWGQPWARIRARPMHGILFLDDLFHIIYVYIYIYIYIHLCVYTYMSLSFALSLSIYMYVYIYKCPFVYISICLSSYIS